MGLITIFGINGTGKDTIANELKKKRPNIRITSMSRLLMYILGITNTFETSEPVTEEQYKKLESIPQEKMKMIEQKEYKELLIGLSKKDQETILLTHLVSVLRHGEELIYLEDRPTPSWLIENSSTLIQLVVPPEILSERRKKDNSRKRDINIEEIEKHQKMCFKEWKRLKKEQPSKTMYTVVNINLDETVETVDEVIKVENNKLENNQKEGEKDER